MPWNNRGLTACATSSSSLRHVVGLSTWGIKRCVHFPLTSYPKSSVSVLCYFVVGRLWSLPCFFAALLRWYVRFRFYASTWIDISPAMTSAAFLDTVRNALAVRKTLILSTDATFLYDSCIASASAQMAMPCVMIDVVTDVRSALVFYFWPLMVDMSRDRILPPVAAFAEGCPTCALKLSRESIITLWYRIDGWDIN